MILLRVAAIFILMFLAVPILAIVLVPYLALRGLWKLAGGEG